MNKMFKRFAASVMAVSMLAVGTSESAILRKVSGAPGNVTSVTRTIATVSNCKYRTSYTFAYNNSTSRVYVTPTNTTGDQPTLSKNKKSKDINAATQGKLYITYNARLSCSSGNESGTWTISIR